MVPGVDPKVDYAFKRLFGLERNRDLLIALLNAVLQSPVTAHITDVELLNPFNPKETEGDKLSVLDIKARDLHGRLFNIEMQMLGDPFLPKRLLYYWARLFQQQLHENEDYLSLRPTVSICFLNAQLFPKVHDHHLQFRLTEAQHGLVLSDDLWMHLLELPKFDRPLTSLTQPLDRWLFFLRSADSLDADALPAALDVPEIRRAMQELKMLTQNDLERERYEARVKFQRDEMSRLRAAHLRGIEEGALVGQIHLCQRLLKREPTPREELLSLPIEDLRELATRLEQEVVARP